MEQIYLSRRNLLTLLSKLDRKELGEETACTIIKNDNTHPEFPQSMESVMVTAVEDDVYYAHRNPGMMHPADDPALKEEKIEVLTPQSAWPFPVPKSVKHNGPK